jgi:hypothetical protein
MRLKIIMLAAIGAFIAISILNAEEKSTDKLANKFIFKEVNGKKLDLKVYYPKGHKKSYKLPP